MNAWKTCSSGLVLSFVFGLPASALAAETSAAGTDAAPLAYKPPLRGAPASRIGGGTRSAGEARLVVDVIAPDHTGLTSVGQPTLYWFASEAVTAPLEFTLLPVNADNPVVERSLPAATARTLEGSRCEDCRPLGGRLSTHAIAARCGGIETSVVDCRRFGGRPAGKRAVAPGGRESPVV